MKKSSAFFIFLGGLAAGVAVGVLFAPDKGKNTRDKLSFQLGRYRESLKQLIDELIDEKNPEQTEAKSEGQKVINDAKEKAEKLLQDVEELIGQIKTKK